MTDYEQDLYDRAAFGKQVEQFWGSQVGTYLQNRAKDCYDAALARLKTVDPTDVKAIMQAQNEIKQAEQFTNWLSAGVRDGLKALEILEGEEDEIVQS